MLTKQTYIETAAALKSIPNARVRKAAIAALAEFFRKDNPLFDVERFTVACNEGAVFQSRRAFDKAKVG